MAFLGISPVFDAFALSKPPYSLQRLFVVDATIYLASPKA